MEVWCGMIVGFDNDDADDLRRPASSSSARPGSRNAMIGMLLAIPKTPLHARLAAEGRLDPADEPEFGTNVIPLRIGREELRDGYVRVMSELYEPEAYFDRLEDLLLGQRLNFGRGRTRYWRRHPWSKVKVQASNLLRSAVLYARLMRLVPDAALRKEYRERIWKIWKARRDPAVLILHVINCAIHYHFYSLARQIGNGHGPVYNSF